VAKNVTEAVGSLDKVLSDVASALPVTANATAGPERKPRSRASRVRGGRTAGEISTVVNLSGVAPGDASSSPIQSQGITIAAISDLTVQGQGGGGPGGDGTGGGGLPGVSGGSGSGGASRGDLRTDESLLSVVRRYAPGIQFCYDNELKKNPHLRGKLVVSITVLASGEVSAAAVVEDNLKSPEITACVLAQIRGWRFPAIPQGVVTFKAPFVFTPPS
jgi:outer membrane biosynthesis protein TonB